jgi:CHAD domain-containing protein
MACDTAFRVVASRCLGELKAGRAATCKGDSRALHQMRIALTRLRTATAFFSPMVADAEWKRLKRELKWLNAKLGATRDLDVAIDRLKTLSKVRPAIAQARFWNEKRADSYRELARALRSARYRRLIESATAWIENGSWSMQRGKRTANARATPIATYCLRKLTRWQKRLLKRGRRLPDMGTRKRHRLRILNKKLRYSMEFFQDLLADSRAARKKSALEHLRLAQAALGELNDSVRTQLLASTLEQNGARTKRFLTRKREKRLVRKVAAAYRKLAKSNPLRI